MLEPSRNRLSGISRRVETRFKAGAEKSRHGITRARKVLIRFRVFVVPCSVYYLSMKIQEAIPVFLVADIASTMRWYADRLGFQAGQMEFVVSDPNGYALVFAPSD